MTGILLLASLAEPRTHASGGKARKPEAARVASARVAADDTAADETADVGYSWIVKTPNICGGDACIRDYRIPVWLIVNHRRLGGREADLLQDYPFLTLADLEAAVAYAEVNPKEIDRAIRENEEGEEGLVE